MKIWHVKPTANDFPPALDCTRESEPAGTWEIPTISAINKGSDASLRLYFAKEPFEIVKAPSA